MLQNDLVSLMTIIEKNMQIYFKNENDKTQVTIKEQVQNKDEPISISVHEELKQEKINIKLKLPFARIDLVSPGSPAEESGLKEADKIVSFDYISHLESDPLKKIAEVVGKKINNVIKVEIMRKESNSEGEEKIQYLSIELTPHSWGGQGVLG